MQRSKLQALVRASLTQEPSISNEGFLGDIASKISSLFSNRKKILEKGDYTKRDPSAEILITRLKETVLNSTWMEKATEKKSPIDAKWAIPGLDYKNQLTSNVAEHLKRSIPIYLKEINKLNSLQVAYCEDSNSLFDDYLKEVVSTHKRGGDLSKLIALYEKKAESIKAPVTTLSPKGLDLFGNCELLYVPENNAAHVTASKKSSVSSVSPLTKDETVEIASLLIEVLSSPVVTREGIQYEVDWDNTVERLVKFGLPEDDAEEIYEEITDTKFASRFYHQNAWDETAEWELFDENGYLIKGLIHLIDASIK